MKIPSETRLKRILREEGRKQRWLASQIGVSESQVHYIVNGLHVADATKRSIAEALGRDVDDVFGPTEVAA